MRRLLIALLFVFASLPVAGVNTVVVMRHAAAAATFCDGTFQFCDEFTTTADPPTGWTEDRGTTWATTGGEMVSPASGSGSIDIHYNTDAGGLTQYAIVKLVGTSLTNTGVKLRAGGNASKDFYVVYWDGTDTWWSGIAQSTGGWHQDIESCTTDWAQNDFMMAKVTGTGASTVVEIWKTTTEPTSPPSTGPTCTLTADPTSPGDDGLQIGLWNDGSVDTKKFDNFAGGGS